MLVNINTAYKEETDTEEMLISVIDLLHNAVTLSISIPFAAIYYWLICLMVMGQSETQGCPECLCRINIQGS